MAEYTWNDVELPILEAVRQAEAQGATNVMGVVVDATPNLSEQQRINAIISLERSGYVEATHRRTGDGVEHLYMVGTLNEDGRRAVGQWPSNQSPVDVLISLLQDKIDATPDIAEKGRLQSLLNSLSQVGKSVLTDVLSSLIRHQAGLP
jgi:hypothetical protein